VILAATLPDNAGYVAAAYLVFFALVVIYLAIMAAKLARLERELGELNELADDLLERRERVEPDAVGAPREEVAP
jgi:CcmD family protein